jgi:hypothetical protein
MAARPGHWWGPGAKALGFEPGQIVERQPYDLLFGERKAPDGTRLGRAPNGSRKAADLYAQLLCTRNDHTVEAGEPGRTLANGDLLRIEAVTPDGLIVRRALDADPRTGQRRWTDRHFLFNLHQDAEVGYAVTDHAAQGRTVHTGLAVITGTEDRQHAYVALTRGTDANLAYVFTQSPKHADPVPGPRPAPELARYDRIYAERADLPAPANAPAPPGTALGVLAAVLNHDGQQRSATQTRSHALADADHLAVLHAIWTAETTPAREQRYRDLLLAALPPGHRAEPGHQARWLWRTLRAAELAGLDPAQVLAEAIAERDLAESRDIAAVLDARLRHRLGSPVAAIQAVVRAGPRHRRPRPPGVRRRDRGPDGRPQGPDRRARRQPSSGLGRRRARSCPSRSGRPARVAETGCGGGAWRELSGYDHPADAIGPNRWRPPPTPGPPGTRPWPPSAP